MKMQLKNKWDKLKNSYNIWRKLRTKETGLGWDHEKKTIKATPERWKKLKKEYKGCSKFEKVVLQNGELLSKMFDDIRNTGEDHWSPTMGKLPQSHVRASAAIDIEEFEDENDDRYNSDREDESPIGRKGKRPCGSNNDKWKKPKSESVVMQEQLRRIVELNEKSYASFEAFAQKRETRCVASRMSWNRLKSGAVNGSNKHFIASEIFLKEQREMFMTLRNSGAQFEWLKRKYDAKYDK